MLFTIYYFCSQHPSGSSSQQETGCYVGILDRLVVAGHTQQATSNNFIHHDVLGGTRPRGVKQY